MGRRALTRSTWKLGSQNLLEGLSRRPAQLDGGEFPPQLFRDRRRFVEAVVGGVHPGDDLLLPTLHPGQRGYARLPGHGGDLMGARGAATPGSTPRSGNLTHLRAGTWSEKVRKTLVWRLICPLSKGVSVPEESPS